MLVIGIESSAHTFGVGIVDNGRMLANEKMMYDVGSRGMIPAKVAETHVKNASTVIKMALDKAGVTMKEIEGVGYTKGPGIGACLQIGQLSAKTIANALGVGIVPVNHAVAHVEITKHESGLKDPIALYVSGGNSQILKMADSPFKHYQILGETFDVGIGNMLDAFAREIRLKPAWGSTVAKLAEKGSYVPMPYTVKGMDFAFTGLLTYASSLAGKKSNEDLCYSIQETSFSMLCEATERALLLTNSDELEVCGGVAQSTRLQEMLRCVCKEHGFQFGAARNEYNADNGGMIAYVAERMLKDDRGEPLGRCDIQQRYRIDKAIVV
ncbi:MAG: tRNA (adenosine(37)-N6)-threonylcarbamoyltransferase complex transferase subunit TsaD [Candidatus Micrarchaeota archaeon]|nr:tRNA (adenosine(37)-N6)-threonylcarbamoyltransferase complex transferase subunit TsaD [Candidatus Micrarchaeota archaeon]